MYKEREQEQESRRAGVFLLLFRSVSSSTFPFFLLSILLHMENNLNVPKKMISNTREGKEKEKEKE